MGKGYFAGIDSGSTSTDVVILDKDQNIVTGIILPTGAGAAIGAERALEEALKDAGLQREDIDAMVTRKSVPLLISEDRIVRSSAWMKMEPLPTSS